MRSNAHLDMHYSLKTTYSTKNIHSMKHTFLLLGLLLTSLLNAQTIDEETSVESTTGLTMQQIEDLYITRTFVKDKGDELVVLDSISIKKGDEIQVYLPTYGKDFYFVERKKGLLSTEIVGAAADIVGTGALAVGLGTGNLSTMSKAINVMGKASAVSYGANAIERINDLPISKKAKKIAGKRMEVLDWETEGRDHTITAKLGKRKYTIELENAYLMGEIKL